MPKAAVTSWTREAPKAKASKAARAALRAGLPTDATITRARRTRIDPRRWGRQHMVFTSEEVGAGWAGRRGVWECEEKEGGMGEEVEWVFRTKDGVVRRCETVRLTRVERSDNFKNLLDKMARPEPVSRVEVLSAACAAEPSTFEIDDIFAAMDAPRPKAVQALAEPEIDRNDDERGITPIQKRARSISPPPFVAVAPRTLLYTEDDAYHLLAATQEEDEVLEAREEERKRQLAMLQKLLGAEVKELAPRVVVAKAEVEGAVGMPKVEGFAGEESDDEEVFSRAMQLRGGAASDSDSDSDSDDEEKTSDTMVVADAPVAEAATEKAKTTLEKGKLTAMFKPQEAAGQPSTSIIPQRVPGLLRVPLLQPPSQCSAASKTSSTSNPSSALPPQNPNRPTASPPPTSPPALPCLPPPTAPGSGPAQCQTSSRPRPSLTLPARASGGPRRLRRSRPSMSS